jgi:hypothetical protein
MKWRSFFLFVFFYIFSVSIVFSNFEINEIYPNTNSDTTDEYIQIKNTSEETLSLE